MKRFPLVVVLLCIFCFYQKRANAQFTPDQIFMVGGHNSALMKDAYVFTPKSLTWTQCAAPGAPWAGAAYPTSVYFQNKIWMMGGGSVGSSWAPQNEIWNFDSQRWTFVGNAPWVSREHSVALVFQNKIWIMGGTSDGTRNGGLHDVWSFDGVTWQRHSDALWLPRLGFKGVVYQNKIWIMGGKSSTQVHNDVWSFDGTTWTQNANAPWTGRHEFGAAVLNNQIFIMGGEQIVNNVPSHLNEVWSFNGTSWTRRPDAPWTQREEMGAAVSDGKIWLMGGINISANFTLTFFKDIWSFDGATWKRYADAPWMQRDGMALVTIPSIPIDISMTKSVGYEIKSANPTYTIGIANLGPNPAHNVVAKDLLPYGVSYLQHSFSSSSGLAVSASYNSQTGDINIPQINSGETITLKITVQTTVPSLTITNTASYVRAQESDTNASNNSASATFTSPAGDPVNAPPVITTDLNNPIVHLGQSVGLQISNTGTPPFTYEWRHNGYIITPNSNIMGLSGPWMVILRASYSDAGDYQVTVKNAYGSATSRVGYLTVLQ